MSMPQFESDFASPGDWARMYRALGIQIVPGYVPQVPNWKRPALAEWATLQDELVPQATFDRWYGPQGEYANRPSMGIITGRASGNIFVLDLDDHKTPEADRWWRGLLAVENHGIEPETPQQRTGGGGRQLLFRAPAGWIAPTNRTPIGVDIRGQGGFAVLPPSPHESGKEYVWVIAPWDVEIAEAPEWLTRAIDTLVAAHSKAAGERKHVERTPSPGGDFNAFGTQVDGREERMRNVVFAAMVDLRRECPIKPLDTSAAMTAAYDCYERNIGSRIREIGSEKSARLDREGRGPAEFKKKWDYALAQWDTKIKEAAGVVRPGQVVETPPPVGRIKCFTFFDLLTDDVVEEPDYIEPDFAGPGGFVLIAGPPKAQKSFLLQEMLVAAATGGKFLAGKFSVPRPLRVFYLQAEMNAKLLRKRAREFQLLSGPEKSKLQDNLIVSDRFHMVLNEGGVKAAVETIQRECRHGPPDIIAVDPLANIFDGDNENDNAQLMRFITGRLEAIRQAVNPSACIVLVHHAKKASSEDMARDPFIAIRGAGALRGYYDSAIVIFRADTESKERKVHFELRSGESPDPMTVTLHQGRFREAVEADVDIGLGRKLLADLQEAWLSGRPLSLSKQTKTLGRFAPHELGRKHRFPPSKVADILTEWLRNNIIAIETVNTVTKLKGIKVIGSL